MVVYNYAKLRGKIVEVCGSQDKFAREIGLVPRTLTAKLNNEVPFKVPDIEKSIGVLGIKRAEIPDYFFDVKARISE